MRTNSYRHFIVQLILFSMFQLVSFPSSAAMGHDEHKFNEIEADHGNSPLILAARANNFETVAFLLKQGANRDHCNKYGATALHVALGNTHVNISMILSLISDTNAHKPDVRGITPLMHAVSRNLPEIETELFSRLKTLDPQERVRVLESKDDKGRTAISYAVGNGHLSSLKRLMEAQGPLTPEKIQSERLLELAARFGHSEMVAHLLTYDLGTAQMDEALRIAVKKRYHNIANCLVQKNPRVISDKILRSLTNSFLKTPEIFFEGQPKLLQLLLDSGTFVFTEVSIRGKSMEKFLAEASVPPTKQWMKRMALAYINVRDIRKNSNQVIDLRQKFQEDIAGDKTIAAEDRDQIMTWFITKTNLRLSQAFKDEDFENLLELYKNLAPRHCSACYESLGVADVGPTGKCECSYCDTCLIAYFRTFLENSEDAKASAELLACPTCKGLIDSADQKLWSRLVGSGLLDEEVKRLRSYNFSVVKEKLLKNPATQLFVFKCRGQNPISKQPCQRSRDIPAGKSAYYVCSDCNWEGCLCCGQRHRGPCDAAHAAEEAMQLLIEKGKLAGDPNDPDAGAIRRCAWCQVPILKYAGCNSVKCTQCGLTTHWNKGAKSQAHDSGTERMATDFDYIAAQ